MIGSCRDEYVVALQILACKGVGSGQLANVSSSIEIVMVGDWPALRLRSSSFVNGAFESAGGA